MRPTPSVTTLLAFACLVPVAAVPTLAQTMHIHSAQVQEDLDRAEALLTQAVELERSFDRANWVKAARLRVESAGLRGCSDPEIFASLHMAGREFEMAGKLREAENAFERAAAHALHTGDVVNAADVYITLAFLALKRGNAEAQHNYLARAQDLSCSPLLTAKQVALIRERIIDEVNGPGS
jgi:tetratricopeptide (TPR) repeat protein